MRNKTLFIFIITLSVFISACDLFEPSQPNNSYEPYTPPENCDNQTNQGGAMLSVPYNHQECTYWCWASVISMVASYYDNYVDDCQVVNRYAGNMVNCCSFYACNDPYCNHTAQNYEIATILSWYGISGVYVPSVINEQTLQTELSNGRPIIIGLYHSFGGHVAVITGFEFYSGQAVYYISDPYNGTFQLTHNQMMFGYVDGNSAWGSTFYKLSNRTNTCN